MARSEFLVLKTAAEARALLASFPPVGAERAPLAALDGRVLCADLRAPEDLPPLPRATMDGYAVRARDTHGASDAVPAFLRVLGSVPMGETFPGKVKPGETVAIATGGVLPEGCDAVVMVEYTQPAAGDEIEVRRAMAAADNVMRPGDDLRRDDLVLPRGHRLRPQDAGALAALGLVELEVFRRPLVGILATGNEVVPPTEVPRPGQIRDVNTTALAAKVRRAGCDVLEGGIIPDDALLLTARTRELIAACDAVILSGGSSIGARDLTSGVFEDAGAETVFHGISVRPGKPTILARAGDKPVLGMPGVPVSALIIFDVFVRPLLWRLGGEDRREPWPARKRARLARRSPSIPGREDYLRVRLAERDGTSWAEPILGGSAALSTLVRAEGLVVVPAESEGIGEGEEVEVLLYG